MDIKKSSTEGMGNIQGQKEKFHNDNPMGATGAKNARDTGKVASGTNELRNAQQGKSKKMR